MRLSAEASHRYGAEAIAAAGLGVIVRTYLSAPQIRLAETTSSKIKSYFKERLSADGWAMPVRVDEQYGVELNAARDRVVLQVQTGNMARAFYDLMKIESLYLRDRITSGVLVVPSLMAAREIGDNIANFDRVSRELADVYYHQISAPVLILAFE